MSKIFDPKNLLRLESEERYKAIPPVETLLKTGLRPEFICADIGCGTGYFTVPAARIVHPNLVYAADISPVMLNHLNERMLREKAQNIELLRMEKMVIPMASESIDFTFCSFVVHEVSNYSLYIDELLRITKPGGKVVILEWQIVETPFGPPLSHRLDPETLNSFIRSESVSSNEIMILSDWFYAVIAHKR